MQRFMITDLMMLHWTAILQFVISLVTILFFLFSLVKLRYKYTHSPAGWQGGEEKVKSMALSGLRFSLLSLFTLAVSLCYGLCSRGFVDMVYFLTVPVFFTITAIGAGCMHYYVLEFFSTCRFCQETTGGPKRPDFVDYTCRVILVCIGAGIVSFLLCTLLLLCIR